MLSILLVVFVSATVFSIALGGSVCSGCTGQCVILPPTGSTFPCYQGAPSDTSKCYASDPAIQSGSTWECGLCAYFGYPYYLRNDPVYVNMELWSTTPSKHAANSTEAKK